MQNKYFDKLKDIQKASKSIKNRLHKAQQYDTSSVSKRTAYTDICTE